MREAVLIPRNKDKRINRVLKEIDETTVSVSAEKCAYSSCLYESGDTINMVVFQEGPAILKGDIIYPYKIEDMKLINKEIIFKVSKLNV